MASHSIHRCLRLLQPKLSVSELFSNFCRAFEDTHQRFEMALYLHRLLQDNLLSLPQRLCAYYILSRYTVSFAPKEELEYLSVEVKGSADSEKQQSLPIYDFLSNQLRNSPSPCEKQFIASVCLSLMEERTKEESASLNAISTISSISSWLSHFDKKSSLEQPEVPKSSTHARVFSKQSIGLYPILWEFPFEDGRELSCASATPSGLTTPLITSSHKIETPTAQGITSPNFFHPEVSLPPSLIGSFPSISSLNTFKSSWIRPVPPLLEPTSKEIFWLSPPTLSEPVWDYRMPADISSFPRSSSPSQKLSQLLKKALHNTLTEDEIATVKEYLKTKNLIHRSGLLPKHIPELVKQNPSVATDVLISLLDSIHANDYLLALAHMEMSLSSMEVVNSLAIHKLPIKLLHLYVVNCISSCGQLKDKYVQNRLVRLVCVFLQSLFRNNIIDVRDFFVEIQTFCIEFIQIKEAGILYRMIKTYESTSDPPIALLDATS